jgi:hypothetical protein
MPRQLAACRSASEPLTPGNKLGYQCSVCDEPLQVTAKVAPLLDAGEWEPVCNRCGMALAQLAEATHGESAVQVKVGDRARQQLEYLKDNPYADFMRQRKTEPWEQ